MQATYLLNVEGHLSRSRSRGGEASGECLSEPEVAPTRMDLDDVAPPEMSAIPGGFASRGRTLERQRGQQRLDSPEPPRDAVDDLLQELTKEPAEDKFEDEFNLQLEGLQVRESKATGFYYANERAPTMPDDIKCELWDLSRTDAEKKSGEFCFKSCTVSSDRIGDVVNALATPTQFEEDNTNNPPIGSWHLYVDTYAFVDRADKADYRFSCCPGDGLSTAATKATFTKDAIHVTCHLLDHPKAGPRSWTFACRTPHPIDPTKSTVAVFPSRHKVRVLAAKAHPMPWPSPGHVYAPLTKRNYRQTKANIEASSQAPSPQLDLSRMPPREGDPNPSSSSDGD